MNKTLNARLYVEKKVGFQVEAQDLLDDLNHNLELNINALRLIVVYDIFGIEEVTSLVSCSYILPFFL